MKFIQSGAFVYAFSIPWLIFLYIGSYFILYMPISSIIRDGGGLFRGLSGGGRGDLRGLVQLVFFCHSGIPSGMDPTQALLMASMICATLSFLLVTLWGSGPLSAAFSFVMRSFVYEKPIWIVSDSKPILKENLKQSLVVMLIDVGVLGLSAVAMEMYWALEKTMPNGAVVFQIFQYILLFIIIVYTIMHPYIYQLMITFDCTIKELYKNAMFLSLAKLPLNLLLMLIGAAIIIVPIWFFGIYPLVVGILALTVGIVLTRFPSDSGFELLSDFLFFLSYNIVSFYIFHYRYTIV